LSRPKATSVAVPIEEEEDIFATMFKNALLYKKVRSYKHDAMPLNELVRAAVVWPP